MLKRVILFLGVLILINLVYAETNLGPSDVKITVGETSCGDNICNGNETTMSCPGDCGEETQLPPGGGGPSSSGSASIPKKECVQDWVCGEWSKCESSIKTRTCRDTNQCTELYERQEEDSCIISTDELEELIKRKTLFFGIPFWLLLLLLIILLIVIYYILKRRKKKKPKNKTKKKKKR